MISYFSVPFYDLSNSLTAVKRQEKELNIFDDIPETTSQRLTDGHNVVGELQDTQKSYF